MNGITTALYYCTSGAAEDTAAAPAAGPWSVDVTSKDGAPGDKTADVDATPWRAVAVLALPAALLLTATAEVAAAAVRGANAASADI